MNLERMVLELQNYLLIEKQNNKQINNYTYARKTRF